MRSCIRLSNPLVVVALTLTASMGCAEQVADDSSALRQASAEAGHATDAASWNADAAAAGPFTICTPQEEPADAGRCGCQAGLRRPLSCFCSGAQCPSLNEYLGATRGCATRPTRLATRGCGLIAPQSAVQSVAESAHVFELATGNLVGVYAVKDYPTPPCCTTQILYGDVSLIPIALVDDPARCADVELCKLCGDGPESPCF